MTDSFMYGREPGAATTRLETPPRESDLGDVLPEALPPLALDPSGRTGLDDLLRYVVEVKASDLHAKPGVPPTVRTSGLLQPLEHPVLSAEDTQDMAFGMMMEKEQTELQEHGEVDFAYSVPGAGRFRVNVHKQRGSLGIAARRILPGAPDFEDLGLPSVVRELASEHRGLLLVTGPTSSGKTTTCGAIVKHINTTRRCHIVTIEDPIEILHGDVMSVVTQREIGQDTVSFLRALRAAMRQDPDVIFVGEIRGTETVQAALQAARPGTSSSPRFTPRTSSRPSTASSTSSRPISRSRSASRSQAPWSA